MCFISLKDAILKIYLLMAKQKVTFSFGGRKVPLQTLYIRELLFNIIKKFQTESKVEKNFTVNTHIFSHEDPINSTL